jgi:acetyl esterase/lipase
MRALTIDCLAESEQNLLRISSLHQPINISILGGALPPAWPMDKLMAQIAARGYVVLVPNYRLSAEAKFPAQLEDSKTAIRWARANAAKYGIDPQRVAIWGESVGGSIAALVGTTCGVSTLEGQGNNDQSSCVQAAVDWYGVTDMAQLDAQAPPNAMIKHNSPDSTQSQVLGCVLHECPQEVVQKANPIAYVDASDANVPFLIAHGGDDTAVSPKQSQILYDALRAKAVSAKLEIVQGTGHGFQGASPEQLKSVLDMTFNFLASSVGYAKKQ